VEIRNVDVAIIGAGSAGLNARHQVDKAGGKPLLIESGAYGTTCARVGCMPSKLLIAAADVAGEVADARRFGIEVPDDWSVDGAKVMQRVRDERDRFAGLVVEDTEKLPENQRLIGHARFTGPAELIVDDKVQVRAKSVVIATGSMPFVPPPFNAIREHVLVSDDVFELSELPDSLAVIGTGVIGLELGQALHKLGVHVTVIGRSERIGSFTDPEVMDTTKAILSAELDLRLSTEVLEATPEGGAVRLRLRDASGTECNETFAEVLVAAGRRPDIADLDLHNAGIPLDERGRPDWNPLTTQVADAPVFLAGDASGHRALLHEAADEGRIAGANSMLFPHVEKHERRTPLAIAFSDPQMAMIGTRFSELDPEQIRVGSASFANQGRARVMGKNRGLLRVYANRQDCTIVGAEMIGPQAEHLAHLLAWLTQQRLTVQEALQLPFYHPVLEEGLRTALVDLVRKLKATGGCRAEDMASAPGN